MCAEPLGWADVTLRNGPKIRVGGAGGHLRRCAGDTRLNPGVIFSPPFSILVTLRVA